MGSSEPRPDLEELDDAGAAIARVIEGLGGNGVIIGGFAVSLIARPRFTQDVDAMVLQGERTIAQLIIAFGEEDIRPRVSDPVEFARRTRMLLLRHEPSGVSADIALGATPFEEEMVRRSTQVDRGGQSIRLPSPEDLIVMKAVAGRDQDWPDIRAIVEARPNLDRRRVMHWVRQYAEVLELPDMADTVERLLRP